jgi:hypothetical protein
MYVVETSSEIRAEISILSLLTESQLLAPISERKNGFYGNSDLYLLARIIYGQC